MDTVTLALTSPTRLFSSLTRYLKNGYSVKKVYYEADWWGLRTVYVVVLEKQVARIDFAIGPITNR